MPRVTHEPVDLSLLGPCHHTQSQRLGCSLWVTRQVLDLPGILVCVVYFYILGEG